MSQLNLFNQSRDRLLNQSKPLRQSYNQATPFPHLVINELFNSEILYCLLNDFLLKHDEAGLGWQITKDLQPKSIAVNRLSDSARTFYFWLNSQDFVEALTMAVGLENRSLIGDPTFYGAGLSEILPGGKLESCAKSIAHPHLPLVCQFNVIICLNDCSNNNCDGKIEIFDCEDDRSRITYQPQFNCTLILPITNQVKYCISVSDRSYESCKFFAIYYWSLI